MNQQAILIKFEKLALLRKNKNQLEYKKNPLKFKLLNKKNYLQCQSDGI